MRRITTMLMALAFAAGAGAAEVGGVTVGRQGERSAGRSSC